MTFTSVTDMYFVQTGLTNVMKFTPARYFNVSTTWIDFSVSSITNSIPTQPVRFQDTNGVSFNGTYIYNDGGGIQALDCNTTGALIVNDDMVINGNLTVMGYLAVTNNYQNCVIITPPPSDARVKRDVRMADTEHLYERVTRKMPIKRWRYTDEYLASKDRARYINNGSYVGVVAQDIAKDFAYLVSKGKAKIGELELPDMHSLHPELLYGEIVGALQHLRKLHEHLERRVNEVEHRASRMAGETLKTGTSALEDLVTRGRLAARQGALATHDAMSSAKAEGKELVHGAEYKINKAISYLGSRLERLENMMTGH